MKRAYTTALGIALLAGLAACSKTVAVAVNIVTVGCAGSPDPFNLDGGLGQAVAYLQFTVTVDGGTVATQTTPVASQTLQLPQLPLGTASIDVQGLTSQPPNGTLVSEGNSGPFVIPADGSVSQLSVTIYMRASNAFSSTNSASAPGTCTHMVSARAYHSQALLPDGKVLIYGGLVYGATPSLPNTVDWTLALAMPPIVVPNTQYLTTAEIYDPQTGEFTAAGADTLTADASAPADRAFTQMIPFSNGGALVTGGENGDGAALGTQTIPATDGLVLPAPSPSPAWTPVRTASAHAHGCLTDDTSGHALVAGGYEQLSASPEVNTTTLTAEYFDPTQWPPVPNLVPDLVVPPDNVPIAVSRADQACSGFDGVGELFKGLAIEVGGVFMDDAGLSATIDQDYVVYQFQAATTDAGGDFAPYTVPNSTSGEAPRVLGNVLTQPRARAKAAAMIVTEPSADGTSTVLGDAVLVTGGITCAPGPAATCTPAYVGDATLGQLANPPFTYFSYDGGPDVGITTELIAFPPGSNGQNSVDPGFATTDMQIERIDHCAVALPDGRVVVLGGLGGSDATVFGTTNSAEVFSDDPLAQTLPSVQSTPVSNGGLLTARAGMACTLLQDGSILVTGGFQTTAPLTGTTQPVTTLNSAEIYRPLPLVVTDGGSAS